MEVRWNLEAKQDFYNTLDYWEEHNGSFEYSLKIIRAVEALEKNSLKLLIFWLNIVAH